MAPTRARLRHPIRPLAIALVSALLLSGCGMLDWFTSEKDPHPPAELRNLTPTASLTALWQTQVSKGTEGRQLKLVPALESGRLYVADAEGQIQALDTRSGSLLWKQSTKLRFSSGPGLGEGLLLLGTSRGELVALDASDGSERWRALLQSEILSVPGIRSGMVVVPTLDGSVYGLDARDGTRRWDYRRPMPVLTLRGMSSPVIAGDNAIVGFADGKLVNLEIATGAPLWELIITPPVGRTELDRMVDIDADPVVVGGTIYVAAFQGDLAAINATDGSVVWRKAISSHVGLAASPRALFIADDKDHVLAVDSANGGTLWKQAELNYRRLTAPALMGDLVLVGDVEGYVHALATEDGQIRARMRITKAGISDRPQVVDGVAYVYADDGTLAALTAGGALPMAPAREPPASASSPTAEGAAPTTGGLRTGLGSAGDESR